MEAGGTGAVIDERKHLTRKLSDLNADEFFDFGCALSPILPMIIESELVQYNVFGKLSNKMIEVQGEIIAEQGKARPDKKAILSLRNEAAGENVAVMMRDIAKIIPLLMSKQNRGIVFEALAILEQKPASDIKQYPGGKVVTMLKEIITDTDFKSFLSYAEPSE